MQKLIKELLIKIEQQHNIKILFAVESGSRAWRLDSKNSDYDVRFVFTRTIEEYITINPKPQVITESYNVSGEKVPQKGCLIDIEGFDILKFVKHLSSSNPTAIEWLISDIIYLGEKPPLFLTYALSQFKPVSLWHHYASMCRQNYLKYIKTCNLVTYKKYLYAMRGLVNAEYVKKFNVVPPIVFTEALNKCGLPLLIKQRLKTIIMLKKSTNEKDIEKNIPEIDNYIETFLKSVQENAPENIPRQTVFDLNKEIYRCIMQK